LSGGIKALLKGSAILAVSNISLKAISFFLLPLYTSQLTPEQLGVNDAIANFSSLLFSALVLALDGAYSAFFYDEKTEEYRSRIFSTVWITLAGGALLCWLAMLLSPLVSGLLFDTDEYLWVVCIAFFGTSMQLIALPYALDLRIQNKMLLFSVVTVIGAALAVVLNILFVLVLNFGVYSFILSSAITALFQVLAYRITCKKQASFARFDPALLKRMLKYSLPLLPANLSFWVINALGLYVILHFYSEAEVGVYGIASRFATMLTTVTGAVQTSYTAYAFQTIQEEGAELKIRRVVSAFFMFVTLICFSVCIIGRELVAVMTTPAYHQAFEFLPGVMFGLLSYSMFTFFNYGAAFKKKSYFATFATISGALLCAALSFLLIPRLGGLGASITVLASYSLVATIQYIFSERINPMGYPFKRIALVFLLLLALSYLGLILILPLRLLVWVIGIVALLVVFKTSLADFRDLVRSLFRREAR